MKAKTLSLIVGIALAANIGLVQAANWEKTVETTQDKCVNSGQNASSDNSTEMPDILSSIPAHEMTPLTCEDMSSVHGSGRDYIHAAFFSRWAFLGW